MKVIKEIRSRILFNAINSLGVASYSIRAVLWFTSNKLGSQVCKIKICIKNYRNCQQNYENIQTNRLLSHLKSIRYSEFVIHEDWIC